MRAAFPAGGEPPKQVWNVMAGLASGHPGLSDAASFQPHSAAAWNDVASNSVSYSSEMSLFV